jgi:hypothetical protein
MRRSAAKKLSIPTLAERVEALKEEVDAELDRLADLHRPSNVPAPWLRLNWMAKAGGNLRLISWR